MITQSEPLGDEWKVSIEKTEGARIKGIPGSKFANGYVIEGSEEHKAALAEEKAQAAAKKKKLESEIAAARAAYAGNWKSVQPMLHDGMVYSYDGNSMGLGLLLQKASADVGTGTVTIYNFDNEIESVEGPVSYVVSDDGEYATISFPDRVSHKGLGFYINSSSSMKLDKDGRLAAGSRWVQKMAKQ